MYLYPDCIFKFLIYTHFAIVIMLPILFWVPIRQYYKTICYQLDTMSRNSKLPRTYTVVHKIVPVWDALLIRYNHESCIVIIMTLFCGLIPCMDVQLLCNYMYSIEKAQTWQV